MFGYQQALILLFTLPTIVALQNNHLPLGLLDFIAAGLMLFFIAFETVADLQHWNFQRRKHALISAGKYPGYTEYQKRVNRFVPFTPGK